MGNILTAQTPGLYILMGLMGVGGILFVVFFDLTIMGAMKSQSFERRIGRRDQVLALVNRIITVAQRIYVTSRRAGFPTPFVVVSDVQADLAPPSTQRDPLIWQDAVNYIHTHRTGLDPGIDQVDGKSVDVWYLSPALMGSYRYKNPAARLADVRL